VLGRAQRAAPVPAALLQDELPQPSHLQEGPDRDAQAPWVEEDAGLAFVITEVHHAAVGWIKARINFGFCDEPVPPVATPGALRVCVCGPVVNQAGDDARCALRGKVALEALPSQLLGVLQPRDLLRGDLEARVDARRVHP